MRMKHGVFQAGTAATATLGLGAVTVAGRLLAARVSVHETAATGDSTVTVDVKKNGSTVLTGTILIDNGDAVDSSVAGTLLTTTVVDVAVGDVLTAALIATAGAGTLPAGLGVSVEQGYHEMQ